MAARDTSPMELGENLPAARAGIASMSMAHAQLATRKHLRAPAGCEGHLTRRQAAAVLGFSSEFKIREFERQGVLRSVRGPMRTAFYSRPEILALKARLAQTEPPTPEEWTDADLIALLQHPTEDGGSRTALELVTETRISIERAQRVVGFWTSTRGSAPRAGMQTPPAPHPPNSARRPLSQGHFGSTTPSPTPRGFAAPSPAAPGEAGSHERRGQGRLARDGLIRELRDPDPRVREHAFLRLRDGRAG